MIMCHDSKTQVTTVCVKFRLFWTNLMMVEASSPRMLVLIYLSTWYDVSEDGIFSVKSQSH